MSYESKIAELDRILQQYNDAGQADYDRLNVIQIKEKLWKLGATNEDALGQCSYEDLESCGIPRLLAKQIANVFRTRESGQSPTFVSDRKAERMSGEELLSLYNPNEKNAVAERLKKLSLGKAFIVFKDGNTVDVATSAMLLNELKKGYEERYNGIIVDGIIKQIYPVGVVPDNLVEENPLYPGRALRPDGTCDQTNRSWAGVPLNLRQLFYLGVSETREIGRTLENFNEILDKAHQTDRDNWSYFITRYPKAALRFQELEKTGRLPLLKIELGKQTNKGLTEGKKVIF